MHLTYNIYFTPHMVPDHLAHVHRRKSWPCIVYDVLANVKSGDVISEHGLRQMAPNQITGSGL